jgi:hypothetical protein
MFEINVTLVIVVERSVYVTEQKAWPTPDAPTRISHKKQVDYTKGENVE